MKEGPVQGPWHRVYFHAKDPGTSMEGFRRVTYTLEQIILAAP